MGGINIVWWMESGYKWKLETRIFAIRLHFVIDWFIAGWGVVGLSPILGAPAMFSHCKSFKWPFRKPQSYLGEWRADEGVPLKEKKKVTREV